MHEVSIARALIEQVESVARSNRISRVLVVAIEIGELSCVDPRALAFAFDLVSRDTLAGEAELKIKRRALEVACWACGRQGPAAAADLGCPVCGASVEVIGGRGMRLLSIDVED